MRPYPWMLPQNRHLVPWMLGPQEGIQLCPLRKEKKEEVSNAKNIACQFCT